MFILNFFPGHRDVQPRAFCMLHQWPPYSVLWWCKSTLMGLLKLQVLPLDVTRHVALFLPWSPQRSTSRISYVTSMTTIFGDMMVQVHFDGLAWTASAAFIWCVTCVLLRWLPPSAHDAAGPLWCDASISTHSGCLLQLIWGQPHLLWSTPRRMFVDPRKLGEYSTNI